LIKMLLLFVHNLRNRRGGLIVIASQRQKLLSQVS